jgi:hypothetical protein
VSGMSNWSRYADYDIVFNNPYSDISYDNFSESTIEITDKEA